MAGPYRALGPDGPHPCSTWMCVVMTVTWVKTDTSWKGTWERYTLCDFSINLNYSNLKGALKKKISMQATEKALDKRWLLLFFGGKSIGRKRKLHNFHRAMSNSSCDQRLLHVLFHISSLHRWELGGTEVCLVHPLLFPDEEIEVGEQEARRGEIMIMKILEIPDKMNLSLTSVQRSCLLMFKMSFLWTRWGLPFGRGPEGGLKSNNAQ